MKKSKELLRKIVATVLAISVMSVTLWFAYKLLLEAPVFEGVLQIILLACIGILSLATLYFFWCKICEIIAIIKPPKKASQNLAETTSKTE